MHLIATIRYYLIVILLLQIEFYGNSQTISYKINKTNLYRNDFLCLTITFSGEAKKEFQFYQDYLFPEVPHFVKSHTYFLKTEDGGIIHQWYEPIQWGTIDFPSIKLYNRHHKPFIYSGPSISVVSAESANPEEPPGAVWISKTKLNTQRPSIKWYTGGPSASYIYQGVRWSVVLEMPLSEGIEYAVPGWDKTIQDIRYWLQHAPLWYESILPNNLPLIDTMVYQDKTFLKVLLADVMLFPKTTGTIKIPSFSLPYYVYQKGEHAEGVVRLAEAIQLGTGETIWKVKPLSTSLALPVGSCSMKDRLEQRAIRLGKSTYLSLTLEGDVDPASLGKPIFQSKNIQLISSEVVSTGILSYQPWRVSKTIRYHIKPIQEGTIALDRSFYWVYYNLSLQRPDTLRPSETLQVYHSNTTDQQPLLSDDPFYNRYTLMETGVIRQQVNAELVNRLANLIIFVMLVATAILVIKK
ncbi:MAG: hypothetical protein MUE33_03910 [Cytophagaceae bacterium]|nr:hypothetical protein [Cytophagaceae bacterium]